MKCEKKKIVKITSSTSKNFYFKSTSLLECYTRDVTTIRISYMCENFLPKRRDSHKNQRRFTFYGL